MRNLRVEMPDYPLTTVGFREHAQDVQEQIDDIQLTNATKSGKGEGMGQGTKEGIKQRHCIHTYVEFDCRYNVIFRV